MRRIALLAIFQLAGIIVLCQSPANPPGPLQTPLGKPPHSTMFAFRTDRFAPDSPSTGLSTFSCFANHTQTASPREANEPSQSPCFDTQVLAFTAQNDPRTPPAPHNRGPRSKSIPIPTQWPDVKPEPIPTTWSNLKLLPIDGQNPGLVAAK